MRSWHRAVLAVGIVVLIATPGRANDRTPRARLAAIEADQKAAREEFGKALKRVEKTDSAQKAVTDQFLAAVYRNVEAALTLAREAPADPAAFEALKFVIRTNRAGPGDGSARALKMMLARDDARDPRQDGQYLATVALTLWQYPDAERLLRRVLDENPDRTVRAAACTWLAEHLRQQARMHRRLGVKNPEEAKQYERYTAAMPISEFLETKNPVALQEQAKGLLEQILDAYADVILPNTTRPLGDVARGQLADLRNLNVGQVAPEIEGRDHAGKVSRLSETRGKVVVLTFSGNWCGPCVGMYPHERELVARYKDRPFALVSVNTDEKLETLKKAIAAGEITWHCWWDGGIEGPITTRWGITGFPTIFVLDPKGVIRFKEQRQADLNRVVADLVKAAESAASR